MEKNISDSFIIPYTMLERSDFTDLFTTLKMLPHDAQVHLFDYPGIQGHSRTSTRKDREYCYTLHSVDIVTVFFITPFNDLYYKAVKLVSSIGNCYRCL